MMFWGVVALAAWWAFFGMVTLTANVSAMAKWLAVATCSATVYVLASYAVTLR